MASIIQKVKEARDSRGQPLSRKWKQLPDGTYAPIVVSAEMWNEAVEAGVAFIATSDIVSTDLTNSHIRGLITNPSADRVIVVAQLVANIGPDRMTVGQVFINPTTGLPTTTVTPFQMGSLIGKTYATPATFAVDKGATALSGGVATTLRITTHKGRNDMPIGLPIGPGQSLGVNIPLGVAEAGSGTFAAYLIDKPAS